MLQLPGARAGHLGGCWRLAQNLAVTSGWALGGSAGAGVGAGKCRSAEVQLDTASLPLHTSLHSVSISRRFCTIPILTFSGSQVVPFLALGRGPCLQQNICLPPVEIARCRAKHASGCHSTVDDSLVRVYWQHISGIVAQSS